jgi:microcystin degradation protein MlrC
VRDLTLEDLVIAGVTAPETVARLIVAGIGAETEIEIGSEHISRPKGSIRVMARVEACGSTLELGGFQPYSSIESAWARARIGAVTVTFHARPIGVTTPHHLTAMGIDPLSHRAYVVKLGYLHPQLEDIAARHILLASDGLAQLDLAKLNWSALPRPTFPLERDFVWVPESGLYDDQQA